MTDCPPRQFGRKRPGLAYRPRQCAYGLAARPDGRLAIARIASGLFGPEFDIPGGALDGGETEEQAMVREFREETGLAVEPVEKLGVAGQYWRKRSLGPTNNICHFFRARLTGERGEPEESDHELIWLDPETAARRMRHDAHAWAIRTWVAAAG